MTWNVFRENNGWSYRVYQRKYEAGEGWQKTLLQYDTDFASSDAAKVAAKQWMVKHDAFV